MIKSWHSRQPLRFRKMEEESSDCIEDEIALNVELELAETLSTVSSTASQIFEYNFNVDKTMRPPHIVHMLSQRERGNIWPKSLFRLPIKTLPLSKVFPRSLLSGQIFMGMTKCGRFLITYSTHCCVPADEEWYSCVYKYQLHWWIFPPEGLAVEIGKIPLFGNTGVPGPLQIYICQWPKFEDKILVYGLMKESVNAEVGGVPANQRAFVTITAVPSASPCTSCLLAADAFSFSGVRATSSSKRQIKCLKHSFTVHTSFDIAVPYPEFLPQVNLKCEDLVVFNTNNALHAIHVGIDNEEYLGTVESENEEEMELTVQVPPSPSSPCPAPSRLQEQIMRDFADDGSLTPRRNVDDSCLSPPLPTRVKTFTPDPECPYPIDNLRRFEEPAFLTPRVYYKVKKFGGKRVGFRPFFSRKTQSLGCYLDTRTNSPYEFVDESPNEVENLSLFRRKRLAEKTYAFKDCDSENIVPFSLAMQRPDGVKSDTESLLKVLQPMNRNTPPRVLSRNQRIWEKPLSNRPYLARPQSPLSAPCVAAGEILIHDISGRYGDIPPDEHGRLMSGLRRMSRCFRGRAFRIIRRYVEFDEDFLHSAPDQEYDDVSSGTGYPTALNMEVHGPRYAHLQMAPVAKNCKAGSIRVEQQSLDIEAICLSVANSLCLVAGKTFTFCNDYDVEVLDVCPRTGEVLVLLMMRIEACEGKKEDGTPVEQFEASATMVWNLMQGDYRVTMVVPPQKMKWVWDEKSIWNPARAACKRFRMGLPLDVTVAEPPVRVLSNTSFLRGVSLSSIQDVENGVQFVM